MSKITYQGNLGDSHPFSSTVTLEAKIIGKSLQENAPAGQREIYDAKVVPISNHFAHLSTVL